MGLTSQRRFVLALGAILIVAFALRLGLRLADGIQDYFHSGYFSFFYLAQSLASGHGYAFAGQPPTAYRVPFYPIFIAAVTGGHPRALALIAAQALVSCGTVVLAALLARRLFGDLAALIAAALCALYPYYAWHDTSLQETFLFTFLSASSTLVLLRLRDSWRLREAASAGALMAVSILTRATLLPFALVALAWLVLPLHGDVSLSRRLRAAGLAAAVLATGLAPWLVYSAKVDGAPGLGSEAGSLFYIANNPLTFSAYPKRSIDDTVKVVRAAMPPEERFHLASLSTLEASRWYKAKAWAWIGSHPFDFTVGGVRKLWAAFGPMPSPRHSLKADLPFAAVWSALLVLGLAGAWRDRHHWRRDAILYAHFACFGAITAVLWAHTSHRSYLDIYLMVFASSILAPAGRWVASRVGANPAHSASSSPHSGPSQARSPPPAPATGSG